jgi:hypothetical protein
MCTCYELPHPYEVILRKLLAYNSWRQKGETTFHFHINTTHQQLGGWHFISPMHYFPFYSCFATWLWMNLQYSFFWQTIWCYYWKFPWMFMCILCCNVGSFFGQLWGHMCKVNICIMSCKQLCFMSSQKNSFIITCGIGMKFNVCWCALKPLNSSDSTSQLHKYIKSIVIFHS